MTSHPLGEPNDCAPTLAELDSQGVRQEEEGRLEDAAATFTRLIAVATRLVEEDAADPAASRSHAGCSRLRLMTRGSATTSTAHCNGCPGACRRSEIWVRRGDSWRNSWPSPRASLSMHPRWESACIGVMLCRECPRDRMQANRLRASYMQLAVTLAMAGDEARSRIYARRATRVRGCG